LGKHAIYRGELGSWERTHPKKKERKRGDVKRLRVRGMMGGEVAVNITRGRREGDFP